MTSDRHDCIRMTETLFDTLSSVQHGVGGLEPRMFICINGAFVACKITSIDVYTYPNHRIKHIIL